MRGSESLEDASRAVDRVIETYAEDEQIGDALFVPMLLADMAGQLMVHEHEKPPEGPKTKLGPRGKRKGNPEYLSMGIGDAQDPRAFLNAPWQQALQEFRRRGIITEDELARLIDTYAKRSVEARQLLLEQIQIRVRELLATAIEDGQTFPEFAEALEAEAPGLGITTEDPAYLQTVFRTNVQSAYGAGRYRAMEDPEIADARPFVQYRTAGDARVRDSHKKLDGLIFRIDDPEWKRIAPPNGFNCRCSMVTLTAEDAREEALRDPSARLVGSIPEGGEPDEGFDGPPVANVEKSLT